MDAIKQKILKKIVWDYNISVQDIYDCIRDKREKAGFYNKTAILIKMLENLYWNEILKIVSLEELKTYLTKENIKKIYPKGLQEKYELLRKLLFGEIISSSGWNSKDGKRLTYPLLSDRWYCSKQRI